MTILIPRPWPIRTYLLLGLLLLCTQAEANQDFQDPNLEAPAQGLDQAFEALEAGDWPTAARIFEQLNAQFPDEPELLYYAGVTAASSGDDLAAVSAFAQAAALNPELAWVQADLGISLYRLGEFGLAEEHLLEALLQGPEDADVLLHLGLIDLENGVYERGKRMLEESAALDPGVAALAFYHAANYELDRDELDTAIVFLERATLAAGPEDWRIASAELLASLAQSEVSAPRIQLSAGVGIENDDNLTVSDQDLTTGLGDFAGTLEASIEAQVLQDERLGIAVGYDFFQSLHQDLKEFDLQSNEAHIQFYGFLDVLQPVLAYAYRRESYGGADYMASHLVDLDLTFCPWRHTCGFLGGEFEHRRFDPTPERDSDRYSLLVGQQTFLWGGLAAFSLTWEPQWQGATGDAFNYGAQIVRGGITVFLDRWRKGLLVGASYEFESRDYDERRDLPGFARRDDRQVIWAGAAVPLFGPTQASFDYIRIESRSNIQVLNYDENILSFKLWAWR